jgi:hypothetical protein
MTDATDVHARLLDPASPLAPGLRALLALAHERGDTATEAWARQELGGYLGGVDLPGYRKISAPIYGAALRDGATDLQHLGLDDLPADHRNQIGQLDANLGLRHGVADLEQALPRDGRYPLDTDPVLRPALPGYAQMLDHLSERPDGLPFAILYWLISASTVTDVLTAIRDTAEAKLRALPPPAGDRDTRTIKIWAIVTGIGTIALVVIGLLTWVLLN